jgi:hypothetical protein
VFSSKKNLWAVSCANFTVADDMEMDYTFSKSKKEKRKKKERDGLQGTGTTHRSDI